MTHFTESILEETALEWLKDMGCQRIAFGETDERMRTNFCTLGSLRNGMSMLRVMRGEVRVKEVEKL